MTEATGTAAITIPPIRLMNPKKIHQPRPSWRAPEKPAASADMPWTIQLIPTIRPMIPTVRCRWRISTTPITMSSKPEIPSHTRCGSLLPKTLIRWKIPETISTRPISTAMTLSVALG